MRELLEHIDWEGILCPLDIHGAWQLFSIRFTGILNVCIPFGIPRPKKNLFMTHRALRLKTRNVNCGKTNSPSDYNLYCQAKNELRNLTRSLRKTYECSLASNRKVDVKHYV